MLKIKETRINKLIESGEFFNFTSKDGREIKHGQLVGVHWNSHRDRYSVLEMNSRRNPGLVLGYISDITLTDVTFYIDKSKQNNVRTKGKKDRHAFVVGVVASMNDFHSDELKKGFNGEIIYNPFRYDTFQTLINGVVFQEDYVEEVYMTTDLLKSKPIVLKK